MVSTFEMLLSMPAVPAIMKALVDQPGGVQESSLSFTGGGPDRLEEALSVLSRHGFIIRRSGLVLLTPGKGALDVAHRVVAVFQELRSLTELSFMIRGILGATEYFECLVHKGTMLSLLAAENITGEMAEKVLAAEEKQGYIEKLDIAYHVRGNLREKFFPFIPRHHYEDFVFMHSRTGTDARVVREGYLSSRYPASLAEQARRYMKANKPHILDKIRGEAFDIIWWFDRY